MVIFMEISGSTRSMPTRNKSRDELIINLSKHLEWLMDFDIISKFYNGSYQLNDTSYSNLLQIKECIACTNKNVSDCILKTATELATTEEANYEVHSKLLSTFYVTTGYVISITSLIGICLNVLGIYILSIPSNRKTLLNFLLLALLIFETIFLFFRIMRCFEKHLKSLQPNYLKFYHVFVSCGIRFSLSTTILMVIVMARSRFYRVVNNIKRKKLVLDKTELRQSVIINVVPVIIVSLLFTIPIPWEIDIEEGTTVLVPSNLRLDLYYFVLYFGTFHLGVLGLMPLSFLLYYNYKLVVSIKTNKLTFSQNSAIVNANQNMIKVLGGIISSFLLLHALRLIITLGEFTMLLTSNINNEKWCLKRGYGIPLWLEIALSANKLLKVLHSSLNVVIYLYLNSDELVKEWPSCALNCVSRRSNIRSHQKPQNSIAVLFGIFNLSTLMAFTLTNNNQQSIQNKQDSNEFQLRKLGSEYL